MSGLLHFTSTTLTLAYFATCFLAGLGALQIVAAREGLAGLAWPRSSRTAYGLGTILIVLSIGWFFTTQHELIFQPGLAGSELFIVFALAAGMALVVTLALAHLLREPVSRRAVAEMAAVAPNPAAATPQVDTLGRPHGSWGTGTLTPGGSVSVEAVTFSQAEFAGRLYRPTQGKTPHPVACLVPSPLDDPLALDPLAESLAAAGWAALVVDWSGDPDLRYPEVLAMLPAAISFLGREDGVDTGRVAFAGYDLGADLALRAASSDQSIRAVVALAPLLGEAVADFGLGVLSEWSYWQAWRRAGTACRLLGELEPLGRLRHLAHRPMLVVYGDRDRLVDVGKAQAALRQAALGCRVDVLPGAGHRVVGESRQVVRRVRRWLEEHV